MRTRTIDADDEHAFAGAPLPADGSTGSWFLLPASFVCALAGVALALGPRIAPAQAGLWKKALANGATPGLLLGCAGACVGLHLVARALGRRLTALADRSEDRFVHEQLAADLAQSKASLQELRVEFIYLKETLANLGRDLPAQIGEAQENSTRDAIYRMAASLDQVGARLEQRMRSEQNGLDERLAELQQALHATREQIHHLASGPAAEPSAPAHQALVESWSPAPGPIGLGVLDTLDDGPSAAWTAPGPLPSAHDDYTEKLSLLTELLSDPRVRAVCDGMVRSPGR